MSLTAPQNPRTERFLWMLVIPLILVMVATTIPRLTSDIYWLDEEMTVSMSGGAQYGPITVGEILIRTSRDRWPPLHNLIIVGWAAVFGWSEFSTRVFSLFIGLIALAIVYRMGADVVNRRVGLVTACLFALSSFYANYLHEARGYTMYVLFVALAVWLYWRIRQQGSGKRWQYILLWTALVAQLYTHYVAISFVGALGIYHLTQFPRGKSAQDHTWHNLMRTLLYTALAYAPWIAVAISSMLVERQFSRGKDVFVVLRDALTDFGNGYALLIVIPLVIALVLYRQKPMRYLAFLCGMTLMVAFIMNILADFLFHSRHIMLILPMLYAMVAIGIVSIAQRIPRRGYAVAIAFLLMWGVAGEQGYMANDVIEGNIPSAGMDAVLNTLAQCDQESDMVVYYARPLSNQADSNRVFHYYMYGLNYQYAQIGALDSLKDSSPIPDTYEARAELLTQDTDYLWYVQFANLPAIQQVERADRVFQSQYAHCGQVLNTSGVEAFVYSNEPELVCTTQTIPLPPCSAPLFGGQ